MFMPEPHSFVGCSHRLVTDASVWQNATQAPVRLGWPCGAEMGCCVLYHLQLCTVRSFSLPLPCTLTMRVYLCIQVCFLESWLLNVYQQVTAASLELQVLS